MSWWQRWRHRARMEEQLDKELRFHLEEHAANLVARGHTLEEARRLARLELGGAEQVKENCRDARGTRWLDDLLQDVRYTLRTLRQRPGFAAVALLTLALGTGATTVMFTVINGVLLKPLPYADPDRLVSLQEKTDYSTQWGNLWAYTYPNFVDCRRQSRSLNLAAWHYAGSTITSPGPADYVDALEISSNLFSVLGVPMLQGRTFTEEEDRLGAPPVAIISSGLWQRRFGESPSAIGATLLFDGKAYTVVGITPAGFRVSADEFDVFTPIGQDPSPRMQNREAHGIRAWARLRPGATLAQSQAELAVIGRQLAAQYPKSNKSRTFVAQPLRPDVGDVRSTLWLLLGAVTLVLLIACVNIASLLLARAVSRERELAMRMALGAGRGRLARQCLTESALLGLGGGLLGLLLALLGIRPFLTFWPGTLPRAEEVQLDWHVLAFAVAVSLASGLLFGLAPALRVPVRELEQALRSGARSIAGSSRRLHRGFVISEIALAVVLLISAGMLGRTLLHLASLDTGVNVHNVLTARTALSPATLADPARTRAAWQEVMDRARRVSGVEAVAVVDTVPMREGYNAIGYWTTPAEPPSNQQPLVSATCVTPDYLKVVGLRLRAGRFITDQDRMGSASAVVIDDVMARQAFAGRDPLGQHLWTSLGADPATVVGVVGHVRYWGAGDDQAQVRAQLYYAFAQLPDQLVRRWSELMSVTVRTAIPPLGVVEPLRREVRGATGDQVLYEVRTLEQLSSATLARQRFLLLLFAIFAALALLLACIGIYGVQAYVTSRRVPEIGVRMALGADSRQVLWMVLRDALGMVLAGLALGVVGALAAGRVMLRSVEGMQPGDPETFAVLLPVLMAAALFASFLPARRASRIDPVSALRQE